MKIPPILQNVRSRPATVWITSSVIALVNRLVYTLTIACIPDLLQSSMHVPRASNGIITTAFGVGGLIGGSCIGYISDRTQNRIVPQLAAATLYIVSGCIFFFSKSFYQIVIFRIVLGIASSIADTMLFTTVADVYPANLLGLKMSVIFVFDNIGNMLGPLLGGKAYEKMGVRGIAVISMGLGAAELLMLLLFVRNSLDIRRMITSTSVAQAASASNLAFESTIVSACPSSHASLVEAPSSVNPTRASIELLEPKNSKSLPCTPDSSEASINLDKTESTKRNKSMQLYKLLLQLPVVGPVVSIFVATGMQSVVETIIPLRLYDRFGYSPSTISIAFLIVGAVLIVAMPIVGYVNDAVILKYGEAMRYYTIALGAALMLLSLVVTAAASKYALLIFGYAVFAITAMIVIVPAQSAFGDFINTAESHAMAQCYSLAWIAEGLANISLPPLASGLYSVIGFLAMLSSMGAVLCAVCAITVLAFPLKLYWKS
ncbi:hypothetical protein GGI26_005861 [Coemansia sp. RSA 1358]|uniref:Major facilitator superfamily (MFS) profile domain-containing protein n=1 Tax=Coemansia umbellata TaxID=1424467 RepID=A0ABQ8PEX0_9FUNG|nr:major facilitator superfamily domain-containing protein [Coemansia spiralis]KAJ1987602.1 hypothetical protein EDC05_005744 [Coemansia umbellata]KAJ2619400.1 hypothetical protein GGI26_005861 [Coemansia sp. RSA 1358]